MGGKQSRGSPHGNLLEGTQWLRTVVQQHQKRIHILKSVDIPAHFRNPELLKTLAGYKLIHKDELSQNRRAIF